MRIKDIELHWFRGAANSAKLNLNSKSMVVYGANGSGKSSFVDSVEHVLSGGKIGHLAHEYSGTRQEKGVINTHCSSSGKSAQFSIKFADDSELISKIKDNGSFSRSGAEHVGIPDWEYHRTVLRQDEVARFINQRKGEKYSTLLPLLGLDHLETAAENLHKLAGKIEDKSKIESSKQDLEGVQREREEVFGENMDEEIFKTIEDLFKEYFPDKEVNDNPEMNCLELEPEIQKKIQDLNIEERCYITLKGIAESQLKNNIEGVRKALAKVAGEAEPLLEKQIEVLEKTDEFLKRTGGKKDVECPACGREIPNEQFNEHVNNELTKLKKAQLAIFELRTTIANLCTHLSTLKGSIEKIDLKDWKEESEKKGYAQNLKHLSEIDSESIRNKCDEDALKNIEDYLFPLINLAIGDTKNPPKEAVQLNEDQKKVKITKKIICGRVLLNEVNQAETLILFLNTVEREVRGEIRTQSEKVIKEISKDIQTTWGFLHPEARISDVSLYLPENNKAIDIKLKFHGVDQDSPKITLSEGYRNCLGLCIFLAMAKQEDQTDRPIFLDDVVVSLDRNHRGMIADLLETEFKGRQVILFTHDRDWYPELRHQLDANRWDFKVLLPYETPDIGIRWSGKTTGFDEARSLLKEKPDSAGNEARKIMDAELALLAEKLKISLPYLRAEKNDKRMAHEFLEKILSDGKKCLKRKVDGNEDIYQEALDALGKADKLIVSWGNKGSHSTDMVKPEAEKLIDACEQALSFFLCPSCEKSIWFAEAQGAKWVQCECSQIRWRYGKTPEIEVSPES